VTNTLRARRTLSEPRAARTRPRYGLCRRRVGRRVLVAGFVTPFTAFVAVVTRLVTGFVTGVTIGATA
jgi:hypothetical protein